jgi:tetratricopeptide (TPR) repeat protein
LRALSVAVIFSSLIPRIAAGADHAAALQANTRGSKAMDQKNLTLAIKELESATQLDPDLAIAWVNLGWAHFQTHDDDQLSEAEKDERKGLALAKEPNVRAAAAYNLGRVLERKGDLDGAAAQYRESLKARPDNKAVLAALDRAQNLGRFAALAGVDVTKKEDQVALAGPIDFTVRAGAPSYRAAVVVRHPPETDEESSYEYTLVVVDGAGKLVGKTTLPPSSIKKDTEYGSANANVGTLALGNGDVALQVDKLETRTDLGSGKWPDGHYDYLSLFTVENGKLQLLLSRPLRVEYSLRPADEAQAYKISMTVSNGDVVFDEAEKRIAGQKAARQKVTYRLKNGRYAPDKKSIVPADE